MVKDFQVKHFSELTASELYEIIGLRIAVFVVEQNCPYQDLDGKDRKAYHVIGRDGLGKLRATARILPQGVSYPETSIGRFVSDTAVRGEGWGHDLMEACFSFMREEFGSVAVRISAQSYLEKFYGSHGFVSTGKHYLEDDIPHTEMLHPQI